jgi:type II secretory pathway pseudopilin PulG
LVELMIVIAIIGILATVAIPSFARYQNRTRRSESFTNLGSLGKAQKAYFAEYGRFVGAEMVPSPTVGPFGPKQRVGDTIRDEFATVGWFPEGMVFFDYDTNTAGFDCACVTCFTSTAYGDVDGDGDVSLILYMSPNAAETMSCDSLNFPQWGIPQIRNGSTIWNQPIMAVDGDDF